GMERELFLLFGWQRKDMENQKNQATVFGKLTYAKKFILINLLYFIALGIVAYNMVAGNTLIQFTDTELQGDQYLRSLRRLLEDVPKSKLIAYRFLAGDAAMKNQLQHI